MYIMPWRVHVVTIKQQGIIKPRLNTFIGIEYGVQYCTNQSMKLDPKSRVNVSIMYRYSNNIISFKFAMIFRVG